MVIWTDASKIWSQNLVAEFYNGVGWKCASPKVSVLTNFHTVGGTLRVCFAVDTRRIAERFSAKNSSANCIKLKPDEVTEVVYRKCKFFVAKAKSIYIYDTTASAWWTKFKNDKQFPILRNRHDWECNRTLGVACESRLNIFSSSSAVLYLVASTSQNSRLQMARANRDDGISNIQFIAIQLRKKTMSAWRSILLCAHITPRGNRWRMQRTLAMEN